MDDYGITKQAIYPAEIRDAFLGAKQVHRAGVDGQVAVDFDGIAHLHRLRELEPVSVLSSGNVILKGW